ncbi:hypothetical protein M0E87_10045 [Corynebacterium sp. CCM 9185]|uniref:Secreted protein n=1 Tax=Corynebacterium marambiense TaxID=2765364 RepID=A0ABS0VXJ2_9CORY|nr:hypothetical protein [Corynebacterium marambiense]MBI9001478.1 hypothetical protein [Corynebacterium marambiense]MCK7663998.1 hypothetical protein [Corynebacterium marambiense]MCX7543333.1 hypothetical protein [Corynebacterium marambiense]
MTDNQDYQWDSSEVYDDWGQLIPPESEPPEPGEPTRNSSPGWLPQSTTASTGRSTATVPVLLSVAVLTSLTTALVIYLLFLTAGDTPDSKMVSQAQPVSTVPLTDAVTENTPRKSTVSPSSRSTTTSTDPVVRTASPKRDYPTQFTGTGWDLKASRLIAACEPGEDAVLAARNNSVFVTVCSTGSRSTYHGFVTGTGALDWPVDASRSDPHLHRYVVDTGDAKITVTPTRLTVSVGSSLEMDETFDEWWIDVN